MDEKKNDDNRLAIVIGLEQANKTIEILESQNNSLKTEKNE